jgi:hypothetical protein
VEAQALVSEAVKILLPDIGGEMMLTQHAADDLTLRNWK